MGVKKNHLAPAARDYCKDLLILNRYLEGAPEGEFRFEAPMTLEICAAAVAEFTQDRCTPHNVAGVIERELQLKIWKAPKEKPLSAAGLAVTPFHDHAARIHMLEGLVESLITDMRHMRRAVETIEGNGVASKLDALTKRFEMLARVVSWPGPGKAPWMV